MAIHSCKMHCVVVGWLILECSICPAWIIFRWNLYAFIVGNGILSISKNRLWFSLILQCVLQLGWSHVILHLQLSIFKFMLSHTLQIRIQVTKARVFRLRFRIWQEYAPGNEIQRYLHMVCVFKLMIKAVISRLWSYTKQDKQCMCHVTLRCIHTNCHGKIEVLHIFWVCVYSLCYSACNAHVLYCTVICDPSGCTIF